MTPKYDVIIVGTSFAASFFLMRYLERAPAQTRVLVLERGGTDTKAWQLQNRRTSSIAPDRGVLQRYSREAVVYEPWLRRQFQVLAWRHRAHDAR